MDGFSWLLHSWITYPAPEKSPSQSQNPRPTWPAPVSDTVHYFSPVSSESVGGKYPQVPKPVQDFSQDNPHYESLLVVEVPETSENLSAHSFWPWYYIIIYYILFRYRAPGVSERQQSLLLHVAVHSGLQGVTADWLLYYVPQGVNADRLIVGVVIFNPQAPKSH